MWCLVRVCLCACVQFVRTYPDALAVVRYLQQFEAAPFHAHCDCTGSRVERVFEHLFQSRGRSLHNFTRSDPVDHHFVELYYCRNIVVHIDAH